jgi:3-oxoacyl-[acyl-carrier-protein] synthase III
LKSSIILGTGSYLPEGVLTNSELALSLGVTEEWIASRTGIEQRRIASESQLTSDLALEAAIRALQTSGIEPKAIGIIIVATITSEAPFPAVACHLQAKLGCTEAFAFDVNCACNGFLVALQIADHYLQAGTHKHALVVGADSMSRITDYTDRNTSVLFADGAGAMVLASTDTPEVVGLLGFVMHTDGTQIHEVYARRYNEEKMGINMNGRAVFQAAVRSMTRAVQEVLSNTGNSLADLDWLIPHQANQRIIDAVATGLSLPQRNVVSTVRNTGNTSAGTLPHAFDCAVRTGRIKYGDLIALTSAGSGFAWGACLYRHVQQDAGTPFAVERINEKSQQGIGSHDLTPSSPRGIQLSTFFENQS